MLRPARQRPALDRTDHASGKSHALSSGDPTPTSPDGDPLTSRSPASDPDSDRSRRATATGYRSTPYFLQSALHERLKAAWWATRTQNDGAPTLSALVERIFLEHCASVEAEHNSGAPFPSAPQRAQGHRGAGRHPGRDYRARAYYIPTGLHERLKAAWWATRTRSDGAPTLSALVEELFATEAARLEAEHNGGASFPLAPARARGVNAEAAQRQGEWMRQEWQTRRDENS